jgi:O-antigen ligase
LPHKNINFRLVVVCAMAASVGLSMAIISLSKLLLFLFALGSGIVALTASNKTTESKNSYTTIAILSALAALTLSLAWTVAPSNDAVGSLAKYGKLLLPLLIMMLVRDRREALYALGAFAAAQLFLVASSWALFFGAPVPWASSNMALTQYAVFSSYLDQGIMSAVFAALCWNLREIVPGRFGRQFAVASCVIALGNVFFVLNGRSGYAIAIALLSLAIMWELPRKYRAAVVVLPFLIAVGLFASSAKVQDRLTQVAHEVQSYSAKGESATSSGIRLAFWRRALEIVEGKPLLGAGIGSWSTEYNRLEKLQNPAHIDIAGNGNPHQEYLLWGVQLGIPGIALLLALMGAVLWDARRMEENYARATLSALAGLTIACLFNSSLYDALIGDFFCVCLGLLLSAGLSKAPEAASPPAMEGRRA